MENGINVSLGHDDMYDPFYPLGNGDMTEVLSMCLHLCHMMGYQDLKDSYRLITYNGAATLNLKQEEYGISEGKPANFNIFKGNSFFDVLRNKEGLLFCVRKGQIKTAESQIKVREKRGM